MDTEIQNNVYYLIEWNVRERVEISKPSTCVVNLHNIEQPL